MKKRLLLYGIAAAICVYAVLYFCRPMPSGNTAGSREKLLNVSVSKGKGWSIVKETEIDGYIVSGAYSADNKAAIAVFRPTSGGNYEFSTSINRGKNDIVVGGASINGQWYDLVWYNGAQTEYAEITYSVSGKDDETLKYDTTKGDIICIENDEKEYNLSVCYYDIEGNRYE